MVQYGVRLRTHRDEALNSKGALVRQATSRDVHSLKSCIIEAYAKYQSKIPDLPPVTEGIAEDINNHNVWVAITGDELAGCIFLVPKQRFMKLANLAVHPGFAGKGIGRILTSFAEGESMRQGFLEMRLNTHRSMPDNIAIYQHLGWQVVTKNGNTVAMKKNLSIE